MTLRRKEWFSSSSSQWTSVAVPRCSGLRNGDTGVGFVRILFENGAKVNTRDNSDRTPLNGASHCSRETGMFIQVPLDHDAESQRQVRETSTSVASSFASRTP